MTLCNIGLKDSEEYLQKAIWISIKKEASIANNGVI